MGINVRKTPNWGKYTKRLKKTNDALYSITEGVIVGIIKRTQSGKDEKLKSFRPYTSAYARRKGERKVTLTDRGTMLQSIDRKIIKNGVRLYFPNATEAKKAYHNHKTYKRNFFGIDKKQKEHIKTRLGKFIVKTTR